MQFYCFNKIACDCKKQPLIDVNDLVKKTSELSPYKDYKLLQILESAMTKNTRR